MSFAVNSAAAQHSRAAIIKKALLATISEAKGVDRVGGDRVGTASSAGRQGPGQGVRIFLMYRSIDTLEF